MPLEPKKKRTTKQDSRRSASQLGPAECAERLTNLLHMDAEKKRKFKIGKEVFYRNFKIFKFQIFRISKFKISKFPNSKFSNFHQGLPELCRTLGRFRGGSELVLTVKTWFSHNLELIPDPADPPDPPDPADQVSAAAARTLPNTRAGGQDDVS